MISMAHAADTAAGAAGEAHKGLPQFDSSTFASQGFWAIVSFLVLLFLLRKYVLPVLADLLDARSRKIQDDLADAEKLKTESERLLQEHRKQLALARDEAERIRKEVLKETSDQRQKSLDALSAELAKQKESAIREIEQIKRKSIAEIRESAVEISLLAAEKLIQRSLSTDEADRMVAESMDELKRSGLPLQ